MTGAVLASIGVRIEPVATGRTAMRLSDWRTRAPHKDSMTPKVLAVIEPVLAVARCRAGPVVLDRLGRRPGRPLRGARADGRGPPPGPRPGQCARRGSTRVGEGDPLDRGPGRRARAGDGERPSTAGLPGREPHPARLRRRGRRPRLVRPGVLRADRRPAVHANAAAKRGRSATAGARSTAVAKSAGRKPAGASGEVRWARPPSRDAASRTAKGASGTTAGRSGA